MTPKSRLSTRHEAFALRVARGEAASRAYGAVYERKGATAEVNGSRLLRNAKVAARIRELQEETADVSMIQRAQIARFLVEVIETPIGEVEPDSPLLAKYRERRGRDGSVMICKEMVSKIGAIILLNRMCGWDKPEREEQPSAMSPEVRTALEQLFAEQDDKRLSSHPRRADVPNGMAITVPTPP